MKNSNEQDVMDAKGRVARSLVEDMPARMRPRLFDAPRAANITNCLTRVGQ